MEDWLSEDMEDWITTQSDLIESREDSYALQQLVTRKPGESLEVIIRGKVLTIDPEPTFGVVSIRGGLTRVVLGTVTWGKPQEILEQLKRLSSPNRS